MKNVFAGTREFDCLIKNLEKKECEFAAWVTEYEQIELGEWDGFDLLLGHSQGGLNCLDVEKIEVLEERDSHPMYDGKDIIRVWWKPEKGHNAGDPELCALYVFSAP